MKVVNQLVFITVVLHILFKFLTHDYATILHKNFSFDEIPIIIILKNYIYLLWLSYH